MSSKQLFILSGPIQSGKTTALMQWAGSRQNVAGVLTPDDAEGRRQLFDIGKQACHELEVDAAFPEAARQSIGRFYFSSQAMQHAQELLLQALHGPANWIVADEIGRLEMEQALGLEPAISLITQAIQASATNKKFIFVVRDSLLTQAMHHYEWSNAEVIDRNGLDSL